MHFVIIKDEYKKTYFCIKTPYLAQFGEVKEEHSKRYKLKIFSINYPDRVLKIFYVKYLLANKYKYRRCLLTEFFSNVD